MKSATTGTITATGSGNGVTHELQGFGPDALAVVAVGGTFSSCPVAVEKKMPGGTLWLPLRMFNEKTMTPASGQDQPTDSTVTSWQVSVKGAKSIRVYAVSGTPTSMTVEITSGTVAEMGGDTPVLQTTVSDPTAFSSGITLSDASSITFGTGNDVTLQWDATNLLMAAAADDSLFEIGDSAATQKSFDLKWYGNGANGADYLYADASANLIYTTGVDLQFKDSDFLVFGTGSGATGDINITWDGTDLLVAQTTADSNIKWGVSGAGINHIFYGDTASRDMSWDQSNDQLLFADNAKLAIGSGAGAAGDITFSWDATRMNVNQLTADSEIRWGVDGAGIDQRWYGDTASAYALWDQSADTLIFGGVAGIQGAVVKQNGAVAITTTRAVTRADSGGVFTVAQSSAYAITVAQPSAAGERYLFQLVSAGAFNVTIAATGCTFEGTITIDGATIPATGSTLTFATGASVLGDSIELVATSTTKFYARCIASGAGGITIS